MAVELATAYVSIVPSTKGIAGQLRDQLSGPVEGAGKEQGSRLGGALSGAAGKAAKAGAAGVAAGFGAALFKGFGRLKAIDDAQFKLQGLGHDAETVEVIMQSALDSVKGTAFGLGDAATIAASAVAAGVEPGDDLTRTLSLTGDAASIAGTSLSEMGAIFGKVGASNRMMTEEMNQLQDRGLPILSWLQDEYGATAAEAREMVSSGEVDFATFQKLIENNIGGAALTAGESFTGSFANMGAALGRFGAALLGPAFEAAPGIFASITDGIDAATNAIGPLVDWFQRFRTPITVVTGLIASLFIPHLVALGIAATVNAAKTAAAWVVTQAAAIKAAVVHSAQVARMVAGWVLMGVQSLLHAAKMAAAWVIAMGPVGWVIAAVVGLVALIVANWDTVVEWTSKAWSWVADKVAAVWQWVTDTTRAAVDAVVQFFRNLKADAIRIVGDMVTGYIDFMLRLRDRVLSIITGLRDGVIDRITALVDRIRGIKDTVLRFFSGAKDWLIQAGKNIIRGLIDGVKNMIPDVGGAMSSVVSAVTDRLPWSPAKKGPLRSHPPEQGGANIVRQLAAGMGGEASLVAREADRLAMAALPAVGSGSGTALPAAGFAGRQLMGDVTIQTDARDAQSTVWELRKLAMEFA